MFRSPICNPSLRVVASKTLQTKIHIAGLASHLHRDESNSATCFVLGQAHIRGRKGITLEKRSAFHTTAPARGPLVILLGALKASTALEFARTAGRIALTFVPILIMKNHRSRLWIEHGKIQSEEKKSLILKKIRNRSILFRFLVGIPIAIFCVTLIACLERTPLTGRWRLIILSPEEEDEISAQLAGPRWYEAVSNILSSEGSTRLVPPSDWRYIWVRDTLRRLESSIPILLREEEFVPEWQEGGPNDIPLPPPAEYPLRPRPRVSKLVRAVADMSCGRNVGLVAQTIPGPPYSLVVVDNPEASNAFSYGFGPNGGGGIVVYSGFLDNLLSKCPSQHESSLQSQAPSWWSQFFAAFSLPPPSRPVPTPEQTSELAILLSHELAHLILAHHLETLSSGSIMAPAVMSMVADTIRAVLFPFTMFFGPFVNDAVGQMGKVGSVELSKMGEYCTSMKQEIEADVVSARLLAHAGFDARDAVTFWQNRHDTPECSSVKQSEDSDRSAFTPVQRIMGSGHPVDQVRVSKLKDELVRWELERRVALHKLQQGKNETDDPLPAYHSIYPRIADDLVSRLLHH